MFASTVRRRRFAAGRYLPLTSASGRPATGTAPSQSDIPGSVPADELAIVDGWLPRGASPSTVPTLARSPSSGRSHSAMSTLLRHRVGTRGRTGTQHFDIPEDERDDGASLVDPDGALPPVGFLRVPEGKTAKNRLHVDLRVSGGRKVDQAVRRERILAMVDRLVAAGGSVQARAHVRGSPGPCRDGRSRGQRAVRGVTHRVEVTGVTLAYDVARRAERPADGPAARPGRGAAGLAGDRRASGRGLPGPRGRSPRARRQRLAGHVLVPAGGRRRGRTA